MRVFPGAVMPYEAAIDMLKKSIKKMYGKKGQQSVMHGKSMLLQSTKYWPLLPVDLDMCVDFSDQTSK